MMYVGTANLLLDVVKWHLYHGRALPPSSASKRAARRGFALCAALAASGSGLALARPAPAPAPAPTIQPDRHCYAVGAPVRLHGSGFAPARTYVVSIDDVYFGQQQTDAAGAFVTSLRPGGLDAGVAQAVERLQASDGTVIATATFTVTLKAGARFVTPASGRTPPKLPLEIWDFAPDGRPRTVYLHYVAPIGHAVRGDRVGRAGGQCGYLRSRPRAIFPFSPASGDWTLQLDTRQGYARRPSGPVARLRVRIG